MPGLPPLVPTTPRPGGYRTGGFRGKLDGVNPVPAPPQVTAADITAAQRTLRSVRAGPVRTPLIPVTGGDPARPLWLKPEGLQPTGAFKIRGAMFATAMLDDAARSRGIVAYSSGNHARAIAYAGRAFGVPATVVVPHSAPEAKVAAAQALGAEIVPVEVHEREARAYRIAEDRGAHLIAPFDDPHVIAGQGTVGLELAEDLDVDVVLVPVSGGGLISGVGVAVKALRPEARVIGVEPELAADARESWLAGHRRGWPTEARTRTMADGLTAEPSELTFRHLTEVVDDMVTVDEAQIADAVRFLALDCRMVAEPSGAVTTAAALNLPLPPGRTVAVVSGGNIDATTLTTLINPT
ncbi:threonine ammonia-lyase [Parasphingorhabdus pacifica]